jgi:hypothetical protein
MRVVVYTVAYRAAYTRSILITIAYRAEYMRPDELHPSYTLVSNLRLKILKN